MFWIFKKNWDISFDQIGNDRGLLLIIFFYHNVNILRLSYYKVSYYLSLVESKVGVNKMCTYIYISAFLLYFIYIVK